MFVLVVVALTLCPAYGFWWDNAADPKWNDLQVTWGPNPFSSKYFVKHPRTVSDAVSQGWEKISDCDVTAAWRGQRYIKGGDYAVILLFDVNGYIAGMQTSIPNNMPNGYPSSKQKPPFVPDGDRYTISAYFVDPSIICTTGRTAEDFESQGTGLKLYIQETAKPEESKLMPSQESDIGETQWTQGKCFLTMGNHYWYNLSEDMSCDDFFPVFLLYNGGSLTAFGWAMQADLTSERYEHPSENIFGLFMKTPPKCLYNAGKLSTMHIYLTDHSDNC